MHFLTSFLSQEQYYKYEESVWSNYFCEWAGETFWCILILSTISLSTLWQDSPKSRSDCVKREPSKKWANSFAIRSVCQLICEAPHMAKTLTSSEEGKIQRLNCIKITLKIPGESQLAFFSSSKQTNKSISSYCFSAFYWIRESEKIALSIDFGEKPKLKIGITLENHTNIVYALASFKYKYLPGRWLLDGSSSTWPECQVVKVAEMIGMDRKQNLVTNQF